MPGDDIRISGSKGDVVIGTGSGITAKNLHVGRDLRLSNQQLSTMPPQFGSSLRDFEKELNQRIEKAGVSPENAEPAKLALQEFSKEMEGTKDGQITFEKKNNLSFKFGNLVNAVCKVLPTTAEVIAACSPLSPFSKLIGRGVEEIIKEIRG